MQRKGKNKRKRRRRNKTVFRSQMASWWKTTLEISLKLERKFLRKIKKNDEKIKWKKVLREEENEITKLRDNDKKRERERGGEKEREK